MLDIIRRKKGSPLIKALLIAVAASFFGGFGLLGYCGKQQRAAELERNRAATVNDTIITMTEVTRVASNLRSQRGRPESEGDWIRMREEALDALINQQLVFEEAVRLDVTAADDEVRQGIVRTFQVEGIFHPELYENYLRRLGLNRESFEWQMRRELTINKMMRLIGGSATVFEEDLRQIYRYENEQADLKLIVVDPESMTDIAQPTAEQIETRYNESLDGYSVKEKRRVRYVCFNNEEMAQNMEISDEELGKYYDIIKDRKFAIRAREVKVRQIQFKVDPMSTEEERLALRERAEQVLADARLGVSSFENLASLYSDDSETKAKGGDMGWLKLDSDLGALNVILAGMKPGDISDIISDMEGMRIFMIEDEKPGKYKPLRRVRRQVREEFIKSKGSDIAVEAANYMLEAIRGETPFEEAARNATAEIRLSEFFDDAAQHLEGVPSPETFAQTAFQLWEENQVSDVITVDNGACLMQLADIDDSHDASLEEATPMVREELLQEARKEKARQTADDILKKIEGGMPFEKAAKKKGAELMDTDYFARQRGMIPQVGFSEEMVSAAFALPPHDPVSREVFEVGGKFYLVKLKGRKEAEPDGFELQKDMLEMRVRLQRQAEVAESWVETLKARAVIDRKSLAPPPDDTL